MNVLRAGLAIIPLPTLFPESIDELLRFLQASDATHFAWIHQTLEQGRLTFGMPVLRIDSIAAEEDFGIESDVIKRGKVLVKGAAIEARNVFCSSWSTSAESHFAPRSFPTRTCPRAPNRHHSSRICHLES